MLSLGILVITVLFGVLSSIQEGFSYTVTENLLSKERLLANRALPNNALCYDSLKCNSSRCSSQEEVGGKKVLGTCF
jgi:hypothetical protein